jgi:hypothetical protein
MKGGKIMKRQNLSKRLDPSFILSLLWLIYLIIIILYSTTGINLNKD